MSYMSYGLSCALCRTGKSFRNSITRTCCSVFNGVCMSTPMCIISTKAHAPDTGLLASQPQHDDTHTHTHCHSHICVCVTHTGLFGRRIPVLSSSSSPKCSHPYTCCPLFAPKLSFLSKPRVRPPSIYIVVSLYALPACANNAGAGSLSGGAACIYYPEETGEQRSPIPPPIGFLPSKSRPEYDDVLLVCFARKCFAQPRQAVIRI